MARPPRPKIPELFNELAVFLELFALVVEVVEVPVVAPVALRLATAAKVSKRDTALGSRPWDPGPLGSLPLGWREESSGQPSLESMGGFGS